jgi:hypothetical protein
MLDKYLEPMEDKKDQLEKLKRSIFTHPEAV